MLLPLLITSFLPSLCPFPLFGSWSSSLLPFLPLPSYFPAHPLALELSTSRRRCAVDHPPTPTSYRHHDASLTSVNADLPTFIIACCYILTLVSPTSYDPSTALFDWPARQILRSHLLFLFPLQPRTNGLLTIFFFNLVFFALCTLHKQILYFTIYIPPSPPPCLFDTLTVPVAFFFLDRRLLFILAPRSFFPPSLHFLSLGSLSFFSFTSKRYASAFYLYFIYLFVCSTYISYHL